MRGNLGWMARLLIVAALAGLAACGGGGVRPSDETTALQGKYDMIIVAFKSGQFVVGGGVLTAPDLASHVAYLDSQGRLPATVLLKDGDESDVRSSHLRQFSSLQAAYGFAGFVEYNGEIEPLRADEE